MVCVTRDCIEDAHTAHAHGSHVYTQLMHMAHTRTAHSNVGLLCWRHREPWSRSAVGLDGRKDTGRAVMRVEVENIL